MNELKQIFEDIYKASERGTNCTEFKAIIPTAVELEIKGSNVREAYPDLFAHMETCPNCEEIYSDLKFALSEEALRIEMPGTDSAFDLGFLAKQESSRSTETPIWQRKRNGLELLQPVKIAIGRQMARFQTFSAHFQVEMIPAMAVRAENDGALDRQKLTMAAPTDTLDLSFIVGPVVGNGDASIGVQLTAKSPDQQVDRIRVMLRDEESNLLESQRTQQNGQVTFQNLNEGSYSIELRIDEEVLQIPIVVVAAESLSE